MAFVLSPSFVRVYQAPQYRSSFCGPSRRAYAPSPCSQLQHPQQSHFGNFIGQLGDLLSEIDQHTQCQAQLEAQRALYRQRSQRKRALRAHFSVNQNNEGWQIDGTLQGFNQESIYVEVPNDHTLNIVGNTRWQSEEVSQPQKDDVQPGQPLAAEPAETDSLEDTLVSEANSGTISQDSDSESQKSYQATVEDDFEDLGADASLLLPDSEYGPKQQVSEKQSISSNNKGKERELTRDSNTAEDVVTEKPRGSEAQEQETEPVHGSFERTFRFAERIDAANVRAIYKDGTLSVVIPKAPKQEVRQIAIL